jgi:hypothetical protein
MSAKFNRFLLVSGLVLTSLVGFSSSAFGQTSPDSSDPQILIGEAEAITEITWVETGGFFRNAFEYGGSVPFTPVGTVSYTTNVHGVWTIKASGGNGANAGNLVGATHTDVDPLPYVLRLGESGTPVSPTSTGATLKTDSVTVEPIEATEVLYLQVGDADDAAELKVVAQDYKETVTLTFTSGGTP